MHEVDRERQRAFEARRHRGEGVVPAEAHADLLIPLPIDGQRRTDLDIGVVEGLQFRLPVVVLELQEERPERPRIVEGHMGGHGLHVARGDLRPRRSGSGDAPRGGRAPQTQGGRRETLGPAFARRGPAPCPRSGRNGRRAAGLPRRPGPARHPGCRRLAAPAGPAAPGRAAVGSPAERSVPAPTPARPPQGRATKPPRAPSVSLASSQPRFAECCAVYSSRPSRVTRLGCPCPPPVSRDAPCAARRSVPAFVAVQLRRCRPCPSRTALGPVRPQVTRQTDAVGWPRFGAHMQPVVGRRPRQRLEPGRASPPQEGSGSGHQSPECRRAQRTVRPGGRRLKWACRSSDQSK